MTAEAGELAESNEKLQKAKSSLEKANRTLDSELSERKSEVRGFTIKYFYSYHNKSERNIFSLLAVCLC